MRRRRSRIAGGTGSGDPARSKRLGALLYLYRAGPADPLTFQGELDPDELDALADLTEDDMHLANACLEVERESLDQEWLWVRLLLKRGMFGVEEAEAEFDEAIENEEPDRVMTALVALEQLGLLD